MTLSISDLPPEVSVALDVFLAAHPLVDLSECTLRHWGGDPRLLAFVLECRECAISPLHHSQGCQCVTTYRGSGVYDTWHFHSRTTPP